MEHRYLVEQYLGRFLRSDEHIHHRNGDENDNRIENLQLVTLSEHMAIHRQRGDLQQRKLPYEKIAKLMEETNWGYKRIARHLGLSKNGVRYAYNKIKEEQGREFLASTGF